MTEGSIVAWSQILLWVVIGALVLGVCTVGYLKAWPVLRGMWFEGVRSGNEYLTTQESMLYTMMEDYQDLEVQKATIQDPQLISAIEGQQQAIVDRMERAVGTMSGHVPPAISQFLATH